MEAGDDVDVKGVDIQDLLTTKLSVTAMFGCLMNGP